MHHLRSNFNEGSLTCPSFTEITMVSSEYSDAYAFSIINGYFKKKKKDEQIVFQPCIIKTKVNIKS